MTYLHLVFVNIKVKLRFIIYLIKMSLIQYSKEDNILTCWPDDILIMIFCKLDTKSLLNCMQVNRQWREIAEYCCQHFNLWEKVIEEIVDNSGSKFREKSTLDFHDLFTCVQQWSYVKNAAISYNYNYESGYVKNICIYKDNFILVSDKTVKYYNVNSHTLRKTIPSKCLKYEESYAFSAEVAIPVGRLEVGNLLVLINKLHKSDCVCTKGKKMVLCRIYLIKLHLNECYVIDNKNALRVFRADYCQWHENVFARHYGVVGSILDISIHKNDIYVLLKSGDVLYLDKQCRKFEKTYQFNTPLLSMATNLFTFHAFSVLISVSSEVKMQIYPQNKQDQIAMVCPGLTYALEHGPVLIMAYDNMKIEVYLTKKLLKNILKPELCIDLATYLQKSQLESKIKALDIYESIEGHHLFVVTDTDVLEFLIS